MCVRACDLSLPISEFFHGSTNNSSENMLPIDFPQTTPEKTSNENFWSVKTFMELGASEEAISAAAMQGVERPSKIQALSFCKVLDGKNCIIADQTGSGKTLAYLLPLMQSLRAWEEENGRQKLRPGRPKLLIIAPTSQLAQQASQSFFILYVVCGMRTIASLCDWWMSDIMQICHAHMLTTEKSRCIWLLNDYLDTFASVACVSLGPSTTKRAHVVLGTERRWIYLRREGTYWWLRQVVMTLELLSTFI